MWLMMATVIHETQRVKLPYRQMERRRLVNLNKLIKDSNAICKSELRMNRRIFNILCEMVTNIGGLNGTRYTLLEEIVAMFLYTLAHQFKNRTVGSYFY